MSRGERGRYGGNSDPQWQAILDLLEGAEQPLHVNRLAERLVKRGETLMSEREYSDALDRMRIALHHDTLPRLADSGVIAYDRETNTASSVAVEELDIDSFDGSSVADVLGTLSSDGSTDADEIGVIRGRQQVIEYGRRLADDAVDELFCMYISTDLLEDECLRRAEEAIDRGVEMYLGSRNPEVRELTRRRLPAVTLWEPRRGWLNAPMGYPKVGRLVLVDRRKVMLAVLDEPGPEGEFPEEKALIGEGENNTLVVLVRELFGPRLDHLDYQSADSRSQIHS